VALIAIVVVTG